MTIIFTEEELFFIEKEFGNWTIKKECPEKLKKSISSKLQTVMGFQPNEH